MDFMKKLKRETIARLLVPVLLLVFFGMVFAAGSNAFTKTPEPRDLYEVPRDQLEGEYVTAEIYWIYGCYAYSEKYVDNKATGEIVQREYIIDANIDDYCALILKGDEMEKAEALMAECAAYLSGQTDNITKSFTVTGKMKRLPSDSLSLYHEMMGYDSLSAADKATVLPLYLSPADTSVSVWMLVLGIALLGVAVVLVVMALQGRFQKQIAEKLKSSANSSEVIYQLLEHMRADIPAVGGLRIDGGCILLRSGFSHYLYDGSDLVWAYKQVTQHKLYGIIPTGKSFGLTLKLADGSEKIVAMKEAQVKEQLEKIVVQFPNCAVGYSDELMALYRNNRAALRQVAAAQRGAAAKQ